MAQFIQFLETAGLDAKEYQIEGVKWCYNNEIHGTNIDGTIVRGGLLADEMGLGKTIQMLGVMNENIKNNTLIVLPRPLLKQWRDAIRKCMCITPLIYHSVGNRKASRELILSSPIVLTTYSLIKENVLRSIQWGRIIFDEAHHLRTNKTHIHINAKRLRSDIKWLVTGTPIQNRMGDFYSLCAVIGIPETYYKQKENLMDLVRAFIIKRTKKEVGIILPDMETTTINVEWKTNEERQIAKRLHTSVIFSKITSGVSPVYKHILENASALSIYLKSRQMCILPSLIKNLNYSLGDVSTSKMDTVIDTIISRKDNGCAKLIFCNFRGEIDKVKEKLESSGMCVLTFDGRSTEKVREQAISKNANCDALVIQIQTGCEGLNLQQFSEVYFVSPNWNPAIEDQAIARCHRIGQEKNINVFRFVMNGFDEESESFSMDSYASHLQETKREIMSVIENAQQEISE